MLTLGPAVAGCAVADGPTAALERLATSDRRWTAFAIGPWRIELP